MAGERCNLGKDEAELLKPSSPSSTSTPNPFLSQLAEKTENNNSDFISIKSDPPKEIPPEFLSQLTQKSETNNSDFVSIQSDPPKEIPQEFLSQLSEKSGPNNSAIVPQQLDHPKETSQESTKPAIGSTKFINRCSICSKRVGLTGFRCRCGDLFCGSHRYSDTHDCSFDYKAAGRAEILKNNPVVRAAKIIKI